MGTPVGRIEKEFVFKALVEDRTACDIHGSGAEVRCAFDASDERSVSFSAEESGIESFHPGDEVRVFFYLKNNYHTFTTHVKAVAGSKLTVEQPGGVYKNLQRKYERIRTPEKIEVSFGMKGRKVELNFPKSEGFGHVEPPQVSDTFDPKRIRELVREFRRKMEPLVSANKITMLRERLPRAWEEKLIVRVGKCLWIPSTEEDFPIRDPYPEERIITKNELIHLEEDAGVQPQVITSKLGNILYEKSKKGIYSELFCPILYNEYVVGYIYLQNGADKRERISRDLMEYVIQFAQVLCFSLATNGYFRAETVGERKYEAPIIDMSASGLLFAHTSGDLARELHAHTDLELTLRVDKRTILISCRIMRKFKDAENSYFGVLFLKIAPEDFRFLFEYLYGKPFQTKYEMSWEGGSPPPPVEL
jgi:hypothetical protein